MASRGASFKLRQMSNAGIFPGDTGNINRERFIHNLIKP